MATTFAGRLGTAHVHGERRRSNRRQLGLLVGICGITALVGLLMIRRGPSPAMIAWIIYLCGIAAIFYRPRYGLYLLAGLSLAGDGDISAWYPFNKNFSSYESIFFLSNGLVFSPLELTLALTALAWLLPAWGQRRLVFYGGPLFWPAIVFSAFISFGLVYGIATGGDPVIALWSVRGIYVMPLMLILTSNLIEDRDQMRCLVWWAVAGIFVDAVAGFIYVATVLQFDYLQVPAIAHHSYSIHICAVFVLAAAVWLYRGTATQRIVLPLMLPVLAYSFLANQRRAAYVAIAVAIILGSVLLFWENRKLFWRIMPLAALLGTVYVAAFWNGGGGPIGAPVRELRMAIAPTPGSAEESSNLYRILENVNTMFTIKTAPLTGVGFGNKFYRIVELPDISFFIWYEYFTHNSVLWIWMQAGIGAFLSFLYLLGKTLIVGAQRLLAMPGDAASAIVVTAIAYVMMYAVFAYVDIAYEGQSMVLLGVMMGILNAAERILAKPAPATPVRWPWQQLPAPPPGLRSR